MEKNIEDQQNRQPQAGGKRPYVKPSFVSEEIFETMALTCGKVSGGGGSCGASPKTS
jgi:hypothetical protein